MRVSWNIVPAFYFGDWAGFTINLKAMSFTTEKLCFNTALPPQRWHQSSLQCHLCATKCKLIFCVLSPLQLNPDPLYGNVSAQPAEQEDLHYSSPVHLSETVPLYSTIQPHQPKEQENTTYAVVNFRSNTTPEWAPLSITAASGSTECLSSS